MLFFACKQENTNSAGVKEKFSIFYNGDIITMAGNQPEYVEAVVESEGK